MDSINSSTSSNHSFRADQSDNLQSEKELWISETFDYFLPKIKEKWPDLAIQTIEATKGSLDDLIDVITEHSGKTSAGIRNQLNEIFQPIDDFEKNEEYSMPIEDELEDLIDELNRTLRPKIEKPIKEKPLMSIAVALGFGLFVGLLLKGGNNN